MEAAEAQKMDEQEREIALRAEDVWRQARLEAEKHGAALVEVQGLKLIKVLPGTEPRVIGAIRRRRRVKRPLQGVASWRVTGSPDYELWQARMARANRL